ncbi:hypothetical protein QC763_106655 [Podospora pseudopauciseta]|uniref:Uncharacterized protein n=1 Tax=Podospora pseudopauciseta TaxID=2093780 RepID=A0ABR0HY56_9PEZI|nr:hypothetical protein QC763_106655 [Podospora pseudopauciseta]
MSLCRVDSCENAVLLRCLWPHTHHHINHTIVPRISMLWKRAAGALKPLAVKMVVPQPGAAPPGLQLAALKSFDCVFFLFPSHLLTVRRLCSFGTPRQVIGTLLLASRGQQKKEMRVAFITTSKEMQELASIFPQHFQPPCFSVDLCCLFGYRSFGRSEFRYAQDLVEQVTDNIEVLKPSY